MKQIIILSIVLVLLASMVSAYSYGEDASKVELPRVDQTMTIDFTTTITDRWMNPVDRALFEESGNEYFIQPIEIETDHALIYVSNEEKIIIMEPGDEASFQFGDALISIAFLEGYTWKGHFDFAREERPVIEEPIVETIQEPKEELSQETQEDESNFPWILIAIALGILVAILVGLFLTSNKT